MNSAAREITNEIMATDIKVSLVDATISKREMERDLDKAFMMFREFESNYSRFKPNNLLSVFNNSSGELSVPPEFKELLVLSQDYNNKTNGVFDICVLPDLVSEGYVVSKHLGYTSSSAAGSHNDDHIYTSSAIVIKGDAVYKPLGLKIDLGGIGKGYIVQKVANFLKEKYENFIVDAGGDMFVSGTDLINNYDYWAIDVENPVKHFESVATLVLSNNGVATSGVNKRNWTRDSVKKNHIIDTRVRHSLITELQTVTVVANTTIDADVFAKVILILGLEAGLAFANSHSLATLIIDKNLQLFKSLEMEKYVWKN